jgi:DNA-binding transcriptional LysR family regulator
MNLRQIEVFRAVMTTGSTTNAARLLHVSQPGISRLLRHFELQLGVALFERRNGRLVATPEAHTLHAEVEKVYLGVHHLQDVAAHLRFGEHATLRVVASANTGLQLVPRTAARLLERFAQSKVFFETLPTREIVKLLVAEEPMWQSPARRSTIRRWRFAKLAAGRCCAHCPRRLQGWRCSPSIWWRRCASGSLCTARRRRRRG